MDVPTGYGDRVHLRETVVSQSEPLGQAPVVGLPWPIRAVQLDLARQMETVDSVCRYAEFAAQCGFNALLLYVEGRIRTASFPYRPAEHSYSLDDMARVVEHAGRVGVEVIPAIAALGHCEHFVSCPEMAHLAEERDGRARFGNARPFTLCPSLPEIYEFLATYMAELVTVFPSTHLHVGCDEAFDIGFCDLCRARLEAEGLGSIFRTHIERVDAICRGLNRRMWIWDDLYELFPDELDRTPRTVIMCHWNYIPVVELEGCQAHFANRWREDWLAEYTRLGFQSVIAPNAISPQNVISFTDYARRHAVLGGLLTQWEMAAQFHEERACEVAMAGKLWSASAFDPPQAWQDAMHQTLPDAPAALVTAVQELSDSTRVYPPPNLAGYLAGPLSTGDRLKRSTVRTGLALLREARQGYGSPEGLAVVADLDRTARIELLRWELRELLPAIYDPRREEDDVPRLRARADAFQRELDALIALCEPLHDQRRPGTHPAHQSAERLRLLKAALEPAWQRLDRAVEADDWRLVLRLFLPDMYGAPRLSAAVTCGDRTLDLLDGSFKAMPLLSDCYYTVQVPFTSTQAPDRVRLEAWAYGGQGVTFVEAQSRSTVVKPTALRSVSGPVEHAEAVLRDDSRWAYLGHADITAAMHDPSLAEERAVLEVALGRATQP